MNEKFMYEALNEAKKAYKKGEVPVGAVIVKDDKIIARGYNKKEHKKSTIYHAEIVAINSASKHIKDWRLTDCEMYVTLEPCCMCAGAILNARLKKVYIGAMEKNFGCCGSAHNFLDDDVFTTKIPCETGILEQDCVKLLQDFFKDKRK